ncbi:MAG: DUF6518 family protein [Chloroflexales bacterium]|nr:DUF6518 family protein [Chloroflexales bacterium]
MAKISSSLTRSVWVSFLFALLGGTIAGTLAKFADELSIPGISMITSHFGIWVTLVAVIAAWSSSWQRAVLCAVTFLLAMIAAYYVSQMYLFGFFSTHLFVGWAAAALVLAPPFAILAWPARKVGWRSALGAALPVGLLLFEMYQLRWRLFEVYELRWRPDINEDYLLLFVFDCLCALGLFLILPRNGKQRWRTLVLAPVVMFGVEIMYQYVLPIVVGFRM